ncbi:MAG: carboxymuconolactone decarboxylase family protein [Pseudomonadales bacterium]|nr:carboxymuconolactone decarboxylase family protein [Pseudomonadales bacterium]
MNRLTPLDPAALDAAQQALLAAVESGPRAARHGRIGLQGPFGVWLRAPTVGHAAQAFGAVLRFETRLPESVKEVAICTVGAYYQAKFEFAAHARLALAAGVDPAVVEALRTRATPPFDAADQRLAWEVASALLARHRLDDALYRRAQGAFGESLLVELVTLIGYYCLISLTLNAFEVPLPDSMVDPFPD